MRRDKKQKKKIDRCCRGVPPRVDYHREPFHQLAKKTLILYGTNQRCRKVEKSCGTEEKERPAVRCVSPPRSFFLLNTTISNLTKYHFTVNAISIYLYLSPIILYKKAPSFSTERKSHHLCVSISYGIDRLYCFNSGPAIIKRRADQFLDKSGITAPYAH